jgi:CHAT domain-containing protein
MEEMHIDELIEILRTRRDWDTRRLAAERLGKIGTGNPTAIEALLELLRTSGDWKTRRLAAETLGKIGTGNPTAIEGLRELLHTSQSGYTRLLVTEILGKIDPRTDWQPQMAEDDLLLFLRLSRVKETADRYFYHNYREKTKFCYQRIIACLDRLQEGRDLNTRRSLMESYLQLYKRIVAFSIHTGDLKSAFFYAELFRNRYLVERIAQQDSPLPKTVRPELAAQIERAKPAERKTLQAYTEGMLNNLDEQQPQGLTNNLDEQQLQGLNAHWDKAKKALEDLYRQVAEIEPEFIAKTKVYPISFSEVQRSLPPDTAILEFFFTDTRLVTILILPGAESPIIPADLNLDFKQAKLESLARDWMADISAGGKAKKEQGIEPTIQDLPDRIDSITDSLNFRKLLNHIPSEIKHLIVVPHSYLYLFPIHALWLNDRERVIDRFTVQYFPNILVWKICQNRQRSGGSFIGIENPTQDKDLIFAKAEVASICRRFVEHCVLPGGQASKLAILETAKGHNYFHFSGHAEYNFDSPLDSYLMLSQKRNENLTLSAILADTHMPEADLVTLSACCTGVVDAFQPVDECFGMATGFLLAGAKGVISSLWKVNSIATAFLIDEFYRQFEVTNNKAVALQKAQQWLRSCTADDLRERAKSWDLSQLELTLYQYVLRNSINDRPETLETRRKAFSDNLQKLAEHLTITSGQKASEFVKLLPDGELAPFGSTVLDLTNVPPECLQTKNDLNNDRLYFPKGIISRQLAARCLNDTYLLRFTSYVPSKEGEQSLAIFANIGEHITNLAVELGQTVILAGIIPESLYSPDDNLLLSIAAECLSHYTDAQIQPDKLIRDEFLGSPFCIYAQPVTVAQEGVYSVSSMQLTCVFLYKDEPTERNADKVYRLLQELLLSYHKINFFHSQSQVLEKILSQQYEAIERLTEDYTQKKWKRQSLTKLPQDSLEYYKRLSFLEDQFRTIQANFTNYKKLLEQIDKIGQGPEFFRNFEKKIGTYLEQIKTDIGFLSPGIQLYEKLMLSVQTQVSIDESAIQDRQDKLAQILTGAGTALAIGQIINTPVTTSVSQVIDKGQPQPSVSSLWLGAGLTILLSLLAGWGMSVIVYKWFTKEKELPPTPSKSPALRAGGKTPPSLKPPTSP